MQTILLVEDDYELNESITYMLRQEQYEVSCAYSIKEARERYQEQEPDLLQQNFHGKWFGHIIFCAKLISSKGVFLQISGCQKQDRNVKR